MTTELALIGYELHERGETRLANVIYKEAGFSDIVKAVSDFVSANADKISKLVQSGMTGLSSKAEELHRSPSVWKQYFSSIAYFVEAVASGFGNMTSKLKGMVMEVVKALSGLIRGKASPTSVAVLAQAIGYILGTAAAAYIIYKICVLVGQGAKKLWSQIRKKLAPTQTPEEREKALAKIILDASPAERKELAVAIGVAGIVHS